MRLYPDCKPKEPTITCKVITDVAEEVITLDQAKESMTVDFDDWDELIERLIKGVRKSFERWTGLSIGVREIEVFGDYESDLAYMPYEPITVQNGALQTVGYTRADCPEDLTEAMLEVIHACFENRNDPRKSNISDLSQIASKAFRRRVGI